MLDDLLKKKQKLLKDLDKISEQIAIEKIRLQESDSEGIGRKSFADLEKRVRAKFRASLIKKEKPKKK